MLFMAVYYMALVWFLCMILRRIILTYNPIKFFLLLAIGLKVVPEAKVTLLD